MLCKKNGGLADQWYLDDGGIRCHPILVLLFLQASDAANITIGAERNPQKTEVIYFVADLDAAPLVWKISDFRAQASVSTAVHGNVTLGVAVGSRKKIADQLLANADVIRAMRERVQLCQDSQTEFAFLRESPGVGRINHTTSSQCTVTRSFKKEKPPKYSMKSGTGRSKTLSWDSQKTARNKPHSAPANQLSGTKEHAMSPALHTSELSLQPSHESWT